MSDITTNLSIKAGSTLHKKAEKLITAAYDYWLEYHKSGGNGAVVWVDTDSGHFLLFTRGEYKRQITDVIDRIGGEPLEHPFCYPDPKTNLTR